MWKEKRKARAAEKMIQKLEQEQCEYNKIKKPTNVLFNIILTILSLLSVVPFIHDRSCHNLISKIFAPDQLCIWLSVPFCHKTFY